MGTKLITLKKNILTIFLLLTGMTAKSQFSISGVFKDTLGNPIVWSNISLTDSLLKKTHFSLTDSIGHFIFNDLKKDYYTLKIQSLNYKDSSIKVFLLKDTSINIFLKLKDADLEKISVSSKMPIIERKIDRLVFNVANNINLAGLDLVDLLSKTPEIKVDGDNISIIGKDIIIVMIDDKYLTMPSSALVAYLRSIPSDNVDKIEIMTNPNSSYKAEGGSGIVNIRLKKSKNIGFNGIGNIGLSKGRIGGVNSSITMHYNTKNMRYFTNIVTGYGAQKSTYSNDVTYPDRSIATNSSVKEQSQFVNGTVGVETDLSKKDILSFSINTFFSYPYQKGSLESNFKNNNGFIDSISNQYNSNKVLYRNFSSNFHYLKKLDSLDEKKLVIDIDYSTNRFNKPNYIENNVSFFNSTINDSYSFTKSNNFQDSKTFSLNGTIFLIKNLSIGIRSDFLSANNTIADSLNGNKLISSGQQNVYSYRENTQAAFINYSIDISKKLSIQSGLRSEFTQTKGRSYGIRSYDSTNTRRFYYLFPTMYLLYKLSDKNTISMNYGRRVVRPSFASLNPYLRFLSQYQYFQGNPFLNPYTSNNFEISETYDNNLSISTQYSYSKKSISGISLYQDNTSTSITTLSNFLSRKSFLVATTYTLSNFDWLESSNEIDIYYNSSTSSLASTPTIIKGWGGAISMDNTYFVNKTKTIILGSYFCYQFPDVSGIYNNKKYYYLDLSGRYSLLNKKLQISLRVSDIFRTKNIGSSYMVNGISVSDYTNNDTRRLSVAIKYIFGNNKMKNGQAYSQNTNQSRSN